MSAIGAKRTPPYPLGATIGIGRYCGHSIEARRRAAYDAALWPRQNFGGNGDEFKMPGRTDRGRRAAGDGGASRNPHLCPDAVLQHFFLRPSAGASY